ncbi:CHAT domain-containing protein [Solirubrobacter phytolaccae]|uniref:CHAT domain-containing protein n=1 Tax=Solirubrobacter phytolaccae TaxID=1404360 RepID=A0A9X3ND21_9ACTN|nr:CHAT domain-containing protein [Solirubrobacter phytolaccae]MDA0182949.1 CHAT domain-containing protein [Solirubrobacter phytolaccae]
MPEHDSGTAMQTAVIKVTRSAPAADFTVELLDADGDRLEIETMVAGLPELAALQVLPSAATIGQALVAFYADTTSSHQFSPIGTALGDLLLGGKVGAHWTRLQGAGPHRTLLQIEDPDLALLPWELIRHGQRRLFANPQAPWARADALVPEPAEELLPLRLLVVEAPGMGLDTAAETRGIKAALSAFDGAVDAHFLTNPSESDLRAAFEFRPHVFHFSGHAGPDPDSGLPGLQIADLSLTSDYVVHFLSNELPRLVVLNACRTANGDVGQVHTLVESFLEIGAAAVVGMRGDIHGAPAACFGEQLYRALAAHHPIDVAVATARNELARSHSAVLRDWSLPSLTLRVPPEHVLPMCERTTKDDRKALEDELGDRLRTFVDRSNERRKLTAIDPHVGSPERLVVVHGEMESGKTALLQWIRRRSAMRGVCVRYVDFRSPERINFVRALEIIRDEPDDVALLGLSPTAFSSFNYDLGFLLEGRLPVAHSNGVSAVPAPERPKSYELGENMVDEIFTSFRTALQSATSAERPLVLILDHVGAVLQPDFTDRLYPLLIKRVLATKELEHVRIVVVLSPEQRRDYWPASDADVGYRVPVDLLKPGEFQRCAEDVVLALGKPLNAVLSNLIAALEPLFAPADWVPKKLDEVRGLIP